MFTYVCLSFMQEPCRSSTQTAGMVVRLADLLHRVCLFVLSHALWQRFTARVVAIVVADSEAVPWALTVAKAVTAAASEEEQFAP